METDSICFLSFCFFSLFAGKIISNYLYPEPDTFLEAYGGCEDQDEQTIKFETISSDEKSIDALISKNPR